MNLLNRLIREEEGQDVIEYVLIAAAISVIAIPIVPSIGSAVQTAWTDGPDERQEHPWLRLVATRRRRSRTLVGAFLRLFFDHIPYSDNDAGSLLAWFVTSAVRTRSSTCCSPRRSRSSSLATWPAIEAGDPSVLSELDTNTQNLWQPPPPGGRWVVTAFQIAALAVGLAACATDVAVATGAQHAHRRRRDRRHRRPHPAAGRAGVLRHAAFGLLVGLAVFFPFFALGGMGGGDVKLMAALGTWIGWSPIIWTALYGAVAGGVMAVAVGLSHGYLRQAISNVGGLLVFWATQGIKPVAALTLEHGHGPRLPYALPIFVGLVVTLWRH